MINPKAYTKPSRLGAGTANSGTVLCGDQQYRTLAELGADGAPQVNSDWNAVSGVARILNKPAQMSPLSHAHVSTDIIGTAVVSDDPRLSDAREPVAHAHPYEPENANIQTHVVLAHAPANAQANADITKAEIEAKLTGTISSHSHSGGTDLWVYVVLVSDFVTSSATAVPVTGLQFTPALNKRYEFEGKFLLRTATTTVGPRPGLAWPTGMSDGVASLWMTSSATAQLIANGNINAALLIAVGGLPTNTLSYPAYLEGLVIAGVSPSGTVRVQLASETAGTNVTMKAGSFIKYREVA